MKVGLFGDGSWACALADLILWKGHDLYWWAHREDLAECLSSTGRHPSIFPEHQFPREKIALVTTDGSAILREAELLVLAIPSRYVSAALDPWELNGKPWISCTKGLLPDTGMLPTGYLSRRGISLLSVLSGPSYAEEVLKRRHTWVGLGSHDPSLHELAEAALATAYFHLIPTRAAASLEWVGVLKNIYAVGLGAVSLLGDNARAAMASFMLQELKALLQTWVPEEEADFLSPGWAGDFLVTAFGLHSRNQRLGQYIAQGHSPRMALMRAGGVAEGYYAAQSLRGKVSADFPLLNTIIEVLTEALAPERLPSLLVERLGVT